MKSILWECHDFPVTECSQQCKQNEQCRQDQIPVNERAEIYCQTEQCDRAEQIREYVDRSCHALLDDLDFICPFQIDMFDTAQTAQMLVQLLNPIFSSLLLHLNSFEYPIILLKDGNYFSKFFNLLFWRFYTPRSHHKLKKIHSNLFWVYKERINMFAIHYLENNTAVLSQCLTFPTKYQRR